MEENKNPAKEPRADRVYQSEFKGSDWPWWRIALAAAWKVLSFLLIVALCIAGMYVLLIGGCWLLARGKVF